MIFEATKKEKKIGIPEAGKELAAEQYVAYIHSGLCPEAEKGTLRDFLLGSPFGRTWNPLKIKCKKFIKTDVAVLSFPQIYVLTNAHMICLFS